jgi:Tfp pilus assembly protein PilF
MFFSKLFRKDAASCLEKAEKLLSTCNFAEARLTLEDARERLDHNAPESGTMAAAIEEKFIFAGNRLAEMNLKEAEHCLNTGDIDKAAEHLNLSLDLADDVTIRDKANKLSTLLKREPPPSRQRSRMRRMRRLSLPRL